MNQNLSKLILFNIILYYYFILNNRYDKLKIRHQLELEGYSNEMKGLKQHLKHITHIVRHRERLNSCYQIKDDIRDFVIQELNDDDDDDERNYKDIVDNYDENIVNK